MILLPELRVLAREAAETVPDVPPGLLVAMAVCESGDRTNPEAGCDPEAVRQEPQIGDESRGLCQILTRTARDVGADPDRLFEPAYNLHVAALYLSACARYIDAPGDERNRLLLAVAAYNCGMGRVKKAIHRATSTLGLTDWRAVLKYLDADPASESRNEGITRRHVTHIDRIWQSEGAREDHEA